MVGRLQNMRWENLCIQKFKNIILQKASKLQNFGQQTLWP
jgi:hypothetical protein